MAVGSLLILDPVIIHAKRSIKFTITIQIMSTASGRLVFRTFLTDPHTNCQMVTSKTLTVKGTQSKWKRFWA
ncbi:hypothetical protein Naga_101150g1 [Nannochloropsis gaditana]|uniref:Uncharacterized protein n=1 Tax=Nannochloropsis gaditana TaxID=72520 RepID=W7T1L5_9STRA|nr:hypothetical protein Naga_101150g1 [Nannochloropsis gaditana]